MEKAQKSIGDNYEIVLGKMQYETAYAYIALVAT